MFVVLSKYLLILEMKIIKIILNIWVIENIYFLLYFLFMIFILLFFYFMYEIFFEMWKLIEKRINYFENRLICKVNVIFSFIYDYFIIVFINYL